MKLLLILAGLLVGLLEAESLVRLLNVTPIPISPLPIPTYRLSDNPILRYEFRPDYRSDARTCDFVHRGFVTNSEGFRDRERRVENPPEPSE